MDFPEGADAKASGRFGVSLWSNSLMRRTPRSLRAWAPFKIHLSSVQKYLNPTYLTFIFLEDVSIGLLEIESRLVLPDPTISAALMVKLYVWGFSILHFAYGQIAIKVDEKIRNFTLSCGRVLVCGRSITPPFPYPSEGGGLEGSIKGMEVER